MKKILLLFCLLAGVSTRGQQSSYVIVAAQFQSHLYTFDPISCEKRFKGGTDSILNDIALTPDGRLWGITSRNLLRIDTATAATTVTWPVTPGNALTAADDSTLLLDYGTQLASLNINTGAFLILGNINYMLDGDLTWLNGDLYTTSRGLLIRIRLNAQHTAVISASPVNTMSHPVPECWGLISPGQRGNYILGFAGGEVYRIKTDDGSAFRMCTPFYADDVLGADYIASGDAFTAIEEPEDKSTPLLLYPNPVPQQGTLHIRLSGRLSGRLPGRLPGKTLHISLFNLQGQQCYSGPAQSSNGEALLNLSAIGLRKGMYMLHIDDGSRQGYARFLAE